MTAQATSGTWEYFFQNKDRPQAGAEIPQYVIKDLNSVICSAELDQEVLKKTSPEAQALSEKNLKEYRTFALETLKTLKSPFELVTKENFACYEGILGD